MLKIIKREIKGTKKNNNWIIGKAEAVEIHTACSSFGIWIYPHLHCRTIWKSIDDHTVIGLHVMEINLKRKPPLGLAIFFGSMYTYIKGRRAIIYIAAYAHTILLS